MALVMKLEVVEVAEALEVGVEVIMNVEVDVVSVHSSKPTEG